MDCVSPSSALSFPLLQFYLPLYTICWLALASSSSTALAWRWPDTPSPSAGAPPIFARFCCFPSAHKARASLIVPPYVRTLTHSPNVPRQNHMRQKDALSRRSYLALPLRHHAAGCPCLPLAEPSALSSGGQSMCGARRACAHRQHGTGPRGPRGPRVICPVPPVPA